MKKIFISPAMTIIKVAPQSCLLEGSLHISNSTSSSDAWAKEDDFDMGDDW